MFPWNSFLTRLVQNLFSFNKRVVEIVHSDETNDQQKLAQLQFLLIKNEDDLTEDYQNLLDGYIFNSNRQEGVLINLRACEMDVSYDSMMSSAQIKALVELDGPSRKLLQHTIEKLNLSARLVHRTIKVARTIADIEDSHEVGMTHLSEALQMRCM